MLAAVITPAAAPISSLSIFLLSTFFISRTHDEPSVVPIKGIIIPLKASKYIISLPNTSFILFILFGRGMFCYLPVSKQISLRNGKPVTALIFLMPRVTLYPCELGFVYLQQVKQTSPEIGVQRGLLVAFHPAALAP